MLRFFNKLFIFIGLFTLSIIALVVITLGFYFFPIVSYILTGTLLVAILFEGNMQPHYQHSTKQEILKAFKTGLYKGLGCHKK